jgi:hypothetical protein
MDRNDIDVLWQKALIESVEEGEMFTRYHFAALVAAVEREACAKVAEEGLIGHTIAKAIRARGNA